MKTKDIKSKTDLLKEGDYIAFGFSYNGGIPTEIIVTNITKVYDDEVLVHFLYGHHSLGEFVKKRDIIAIGDMESDGEIRGWGGKYFILRPNNYLLQHP